MSSYISTIKLMDNTVAPEAGEESVFADYAEGASRLFDKLCEVEDEFFNKAAASVSDKTFYGNGIDMLELPPFLAGSLASVTIEGDVFDADDYRIVKNYIIRADDGTFDPDEEIVVSARWGFAEVPKDIQIVVNELAVHLFRNKDPMFTKMSNVETERELSPTVNSMIKKYRDKYSQMAF